jgi:hypothetical protein
MDSRQSMRAVAQAVIDGSAAPEPGPAPGPG